MSPERIKHLEFIQAVVTRLAGNSSMMKGWTVTLVAALFALASKESQQKYAIVALLPAFCFWGLDAFYLYQERLFRALYTAAHKPNTDIPLFSMDTSQIQKTVPNLLITMFSKTLLPFYLPIFAAIGIATKYFSQ